MTGSIPKTCLEGRSAALSSPDGLLSRVGLILFEL